ncbi:hypothetical protein CUM68_16250 [Enterococcus faecium]|nr:hypothetical protein [Enterococcus faecium]EGP5273523.1 hypothetical protein [Enterococcus faecium]EGP5296570.1 hypothetical protein [Enterococcus faecium]EGP5485459.1 hypothetical protein [Enterococcus faecium]EGP5519911.1 hypothetical protein [Enterococcus faecium]
MVVLTIADTSDLVYLLYNNGEQLNTYISILAIAFRKRSILLMKYIQNKMPIQLSERGCAGNFPADSS